MNKLLNIWAMIVLSCSSLPLWAQLTLPAGTSYTQNFDGIGSGLPTGWTVRTGANGTSRGTSASLSAAAISWALTDGNFRNCAAAEAPLTSSSSTTVQENSLDRALAVRQTGSYGDPGATFELEIANTVDRTAFTLTLKHQMLNVQPRSTTWSVQYSTNGGTSWTTLDTYLDPGAWGSTTGSYSFGSSLNNLASTVLIRVVALTASSGSGNRDTYGIDDFVLSWMESTPTPTIAVSPATHTGFAYTQGAGPSVSQTYTLSGTNLSPTAGNLTVTGSTNYEVSSDNSTFSGSFNVAYTGGALANTTVYVRLKAGLTAGNYNSETIANSGGGATTQNVTCSGMVAPPPQYYRTKQAGNWSDVLIWETSGDNMNWIDATVTPTSADLTITIQSHAIAVSSSVTVDQLTINGSGGQLTINSGVTLTIAGGTGTDLTIDGTLINSGTLLLQDASSSVVINGTFTQSGSGAVTNSNNGPISFSSGSTYNHSRNGGVVPTATWDAASLCNVTGVTSTVPTGLGQMFGQFTWNCASQSTFMIIGATSFNPQGLFTVANTGSNVLEFESAGSGGVYTLDGGMSVTGGTFLNNFDNSGPANEVIVNINGDLTISGTGRYYFGDGASNATASGFISTVNLTGNLSITSSSSNAFYCPASSNDGRINFTGGGVHTFNRTSAVSTASYVAYVIESGNTLELSTNMAVGSSSSTFFDHVEVYGTLNTGAFGLTVAGGNNSRVTVYSGSTIQTANTQGLNAALGASIRSINSGANYVFNAATLTAFPTSAQVGTFGNPATVTVNDDITLNRNITIDNNLSLAGGNVTLGSNTLTLASAATLTGFSSSSYIITDGSGKLKRNGVGATAREFPIGDEVYYTPVTIANAGTSDNFSISFSAFIGACFVDENSVTGNWDILEDAAGNSNCIISIDYGSLPFGASFAANEAVIGHCTGANLDYYSGTSVVGTLVTGSGFTVFSPFGITKSSALPIELLSFEASKLTETAALIAWRTALEVNNDYMAVERSADGVSFTEIGRIKGAGNSDGPRSYQWVDERPFSGRNYYRLRQVDFDGKTTWHRIAALDFDVEQAGLSFYPSPVAAWMRVERPQSAKGSLSAQILDMQGRILWQSSFQPDMSMLEIPTGSLAAGIYHLRLLGNGKVWTERFVKQ